MNQKQTGEECNLSATRRQVVLSVCFSAKDTYGAAAHRKTDFLTVSAASTVPIDAFQQKKKGQSMQSKSGSDQSQKIESGQTNFRSENVIGKAMKIAFAGLKKESQRKLYRWKERSPMRRRDDRTSVSCSERVHTPQRAERSALPSAVPHLPSNVFKTVVSVYAESRSPCENGNNTGEKLAKNAEANCDILQRSRSRRKA